ncbi:hypothetical protein Ahy_A03g013162 [Arachis hypogaea]|uniref:Transposase MuDR plant domain-containing protein n=1 Tax=Arachis hypogaea TaxID=3818 RepID=A0A445DUS7_ARAHY|nr:hypothetical protein Ahy_A03g013162 [Arachis hypogaea]
MPQPTAILKPWSKGKETNKAKPKRVCKNTKIAAACGRRPLTIAAATGNNAKIIEESSDSHDSDDSAEDEAYRPGSEEVSSEEDLPLDRSATNTNVKLRSRPEKKLTKEKKVVMVEDDGPVCADSDSEDDEIIFGLISKFGSSVAPYHDVQDDVYNDSDGGDSWHSKEMKTPPNSEDELEEVDSDDIFPAFREEGRFGELRLEVGMNFTTKMEFKEAVREYCIQEGRRIWFKKNDNVRMRAVCKEESCGWLVYASNNTENNCWQIKTFNDDHTCARNTKNRLANRKWLACKLVKKLRKYPNLRHSEAAQYFKTKCDLELNKSCPKRATSEEAVAAAEAAAAQPTVANGGEGQANSAVPVPQAPTKINLDQSEPPLEAHDDSQHFIPSPVRPSKLPLKRKLAKYYEKTASGSSNPPATTPPAATPPGSSHTARNPPPNPMQGAT